MRSATHHTVVISRLEEPEIMFHRETELQVRRKKNFAVEPSPLEADACDTVSFELRGLDYPIRVIGLGPGGCPFEPGVHTVTSVEDKFIIRAHVPNGHPPEDYMYLVQIYKEYDFADGNSPPRIIVDP